MSNDTHGWLVHDSPSLLLVLDEQLVCRGMAKAWRDRLAPGLSARRAVPAAELFDFDGAPGLLERFRAVVEDGRPIANVALGLLLADGTLPCRIGAWRAQPAADQPPCVVVAATDVSKYRNALEEITELQTQHQVILDAAGEGVHGLDRDGRVTFVNAAASAILGWRGDEVIGRRSHDLHHHSYPDGTAYPRDRCPIYAALQDGEVHRIDDEVFWHADGFAVPVEYTSTPILRDGKPDGAVVVFRDISQRKQLEEERRKAFEEIQELRKQLEQERDYLREEVDVTASFGEVIGDSPALKRTFAQIRMVAPTPANVLVLGESGVGKEMIARAIHRQSARADHPLVKVNCASIPKELFESEFFGHVRGAFTGAHRDRVGRLQLAEHGTLFLDEVGEIPLSQQGKLLRALQEQEFERVGDDETIKADVRIVAATNRDLVDEVKAGRFREDLFYRLSVFPIEVPALRDRVEDIAPLAAHFLATFCRDLGRESLRLTRDQLSLLKAQSWRGNIRELRNVIERAVISSTGSRLRLDLALPGKGIPAAAGSGEVPAGDHAFVTDTEFRTLEKANMTAALRQAGWRVWGESGAAALLGLKPSTLTYRMRQFGIRKPGAPE